MASEQVDVVVVGAGMAGLAAATQVRAAGRSALVLETSDGPGGRVRTDLVDGFRLDRGFQILLSAYPEAQRLLDYEELDLCPFLPGAAVRTASGGMHRLSDPLRRPQDVFATLRAPVGTPMDKLRTLRFRQQVTTGSLAQLWARPETTGMQRLEAAGFSSKMISTFFGPLFAGITLDSELAGSSRMIEFVFRMLSQGDAVVPAKGMGSISQQLASKISDCVRYNHSVTNVTGSEVQLASGETVRCGAVIVATDMTSAAKLVPLTPRAWNGVTSLWYSPPESPVSDPVIVLNGTSGGAVNNLAEMSAVSPNYAPEGQHLVVVSSPSVGDGLAAAMEAELQTWFPNFSDWRKLAVQEIPFSQPALPPGTPSAPAAVADGVFVAGDHRTDASINGALLSGANAAAAASDYLGR